MKLFLLEQDEVSGYDTYDSCVVRALTEEDAKMMYPSDPMYDTENQCEWPRKEKRAIQVTATYLGESIDDEPGVVCASFNAG